MTEPIFQIADASFWENINKQFGNSGGIYKLVAIRNNQVLPVNRFLGTDNEGVLYIGKANSFLDRVIELKKSISPDYKSSGHDCGKKYKSNSAISEQYPYEILFMKLTQSETPSDLERQLLSEYVKKFGEVPPLNAI